MKKRLRGYVFSREMGTNFVPQRVQNLVLRNYCDKNGYQYLLSATEYGMENCYMILHSQLDLLEQVEGLVFYSTHQLPESEHDRKYLFDQFLKNKKELHFALEEIIVLNQNSLEMVEDIMKIRKISQSETQLKEMILSEGNK